MKKRSIALLVGFAIATSFAALGLWPYMRVPPRLNVVVLTLDTTRADRLSPYGFADISLPHLERLAREGVLFEQASTTVPLTLPAHASLFTGLLPPEHGVRDNADPRMADSKTTLAETLSAAGFRTGAFVGSIVLDPERGLKQGFDVYKGVLRGPRDTPQGRQRRADAVMDDAIEWLGTVGESQFFLWAHLYDPHRPYEPPEPYASTYGHNPYLGEIAFADAQIGRLLQELERRSVLDRTIVVVLADHGESLGDHGERDHGVFVYESVIRVPLIIRAPKVAPARVDGVVRVIDVMPTVLAMLRVPAPPSQGVNLIELMTGRTDDLKLTAYSESMYPERLGWSSLRAVRDGRFKYIEAPRPELYDLLDDPFEQSNIYESRRATAASMKASIRQFSHSASGTPDRAVAVSPELQTQLQALGYVAGSARPAAPGASRPDPKDCMRRAPGLPGPAKRDAACAFKPEASTVTGMSVPGGSGR